MKNKIKYLLVAAMVIISAIISVNVFATPEAGKIVLTKTATKNYSGASENNKVYGRTAQVNLNVSANPYTSQETTYDQVDIVLVVDGSSSMSNTTTCTGSGYSRKCNTRISDAKSAANAFVESMMKTDNVQIGLVEYGTSIKHTQNLTNNKATVKSFISNTWNATYNQGTNIQAGIASAKSMLTEDTRGNVKKILIVLTDGAPTFFTYNNKIYGNGQDDSEDGYYVYNSCSWKDFFGSCHEGYDYVSKSPSTAAQEEMNAFKTSYPNADVYTIRFGSESAADDKLAKINSTTGSNADHLYQNMTAIDGDALANSFKKIQENTENNVATNTVVTDVIPVGFKLTDESKTSLESLGAKYVENTDGTTTITWTIGTLSATKTGGYNLSYIVEAKDEYHGSMFTNSSAVLTATVNENPAYEGLTTASETAENPAVEIPAIVADDSYASNTSYITYETITINGRTVKYNDTLTNKLNDYGTSTDSIVVVTNDNVVAYGSAYKIYKSGVLQGTLTMNEDGTFSYTAEAGITGEVSFEYYIQTNFDQSKETSYVRSNNATVTLNVLPRSTTSVTVNKTWDDNDDQDGLRPNELNVTLTGSDGSTHLGTMTGSENTWTYVFNNLYEYEEGHEGDNAYRITYTVSEETLSNYELTQNGYNLTNKHNTQKANITINKLWDDASNQDGIRPQSIIVKVYADGNETNAVKTITMTESDKSADNDNKWSVTITDLPMYRDHGTAIVYTIKENSVANYSEPVITGTAATEFNITNSYIPETRTIDVKKVWNDDSNRDNLRPTSVIVKILADGKDTGKIVTLSGTGNEWTATSVALPKYEAVRQEINYTVEEITDSNYTSKVTGTMANGYTITNTHNVAKRNITVTKAWEDDSNRDGLRSSSVTVKLYANGTDTNKTVTLNASNNWTATFSNLNTNEAGTEITYTVDEATIPNGYSREVTGSMTAGFTITNKHTAATKEVTVTKVWEDDSDRDGIRPTSVTLELRANGTRVQNVTLTADNALEDNANTWSKTINNLYVKANGTDITYTVVENEVPDNYEKEENELTVTNSYTPATREVTVTKVWVDDSNRDKVRPESITLTLKANGEELQNITLTAADKDTQNANIWTKTITGLYTKAAGSNITYEVVENETPAGYIKSESGLTVTNTHNVAKRNITVTKVWDDASNQDGIRPSSVTVKLYANDTDTNKTVTLNASNNWTATFSNLNTNEDGVEITYTVDEATIPDGYTREVTGSMTAGFTITNSYIPETRTIDIKKVWNDDSNRDRVRPENITVKILADDVDTGITVKLSGTGNEWTATSEALPKYKAVRQEITYTLEEITVSNYTSKVTGNMDDGFTITNTHNIEKTSIIVTKTWDDTNNQDGKRPSNVTIRVWDGETEVESHEVTGSMTTNVWTYTFEGLIKNRDGSPINYTITEDKVANYTSKVSGFNVTNTHTPETRSLTLSKVWDDNENQDGIRPSRVSFRLFVNVTRDLGSYTLTAADGWTKTIENLPKYSNGVENQYRFIEESVSGYTPSRSGDMDTGYVYTNTHTPATKEVIVTKVWEDDSDRDRVRPTSVTLELQANGTRVQDVTLTADNALEDDSNTWSTTIENLPLKANGTEITYTVVENTVPNGYTSTPNGLTVTNTHAIATTTVSGTKTWNDDSDRERVRPESIEVKLMNGKTVVGTKTVTAADNWSYSFTNLPEKDAGETINYSIEETPVSGYITTYDGYDIINTHTISTRDIIVNKVWNDASNQDGIRDSYGIRLTGTISVENEPIEVYNSGVITLSKDQLTYTFEDLFVKAYGQTIEYTVDEVTVPTGYTKGITGSMTDGFTITNTHEPEKYNINGELIGKKTWVDANDQDAKRPRSVTLQLTATADGEEITNLRKELTLTPDNYKANDWAYKFTGLPKYNNGHEITYTVEELNVNSYYEATHDKDNKYIIVNTHSISKTELTVNKVWKDNEDQDGYRPESVTIRLVANDKATDKIVKLSEENNWTAKFDDLDEYKDGIVVNYTAVEEMDAVSEKKYNTKITYEGTVATVTNTHDIEKVNYIVTKTWDDDTNRDGIRPDSINVTLYKNDEATETTATIEPNEEGVWTYTFENLDKFENGEEITYSVKEDAVDGYEPSYEETIITNKHTPARISYEITKTWDDNDDQDGVRPEKITIYLYKNGGEEPVDSIELNEENNWTGSFTNLYKFENGEKVEYIVAEEEVKGYTETIDISDINENNTIVVGFTNVHVPETIEININKTWDDTENKYNTRPENITVNIYADGEVIDTVTIDSTTNWTYSITVDKYANKKEITYTIVEDDVYGYEAIYNGFDITNTYVLGTGGEEIPGLVQTGSEINTKVISAFSLILSSLGLSLTRKKRLS